MCASKRLSWSGHSGASCRIFLCRDTVVDWFSWHCMTLDEGCLGVALTAPSCTKAARMHSPHLVWTLALPWVSAVAVRTTARTVHL